MSAGMTIGVAALGALGAVARFLVQETFAARGGHRFPVGTLLVNLSGSFALGLVVGASLSGDTERLLGVGFLGGYTTYSGWMFDTHSLAEDGAPRAAALNVTVSLIAGIFAVWLGRAM